MNWIAKPFAYAWPLVVAAGSVVACSDSAETEEPPLTLAQGVYGPLGSVRPDATAAQKAAFERGRVVAEHRFSSAEGLGPHFNTSFCGSCHNRPVLGGSAGRYRNFLLSQQVDTDGAKVPTGVNGVHPFLQSEGPARRPLGEGTNALATRNPIPFFGVGLIAEIPGENILQHQDPDDLDGDGISGRPNFDRGFVGRFGRKAQTVSIEGFIRGPLFNHLGITSLPLSDEMKDALPVPSGPIASARALRRGLQGGPVAVGTTGRGQAAAPDEPTTDDDGVMDPELDEAELFDLVSFSMLLAAPEPEVLGEEGEKGQQVFLEVGCAGCHLPTLAGPRGLIPLYSDLLLHDMGPDLADGVEMGIATPSEFRTQPLWGVIATGPWLHDGRADTLHEAVALHGGEAEAVRDAYLALPSEDRAAMLEFLASLGGREMVSPGLLLPTDPAPSEGALGGPIPGLSSAERALFDEGRALFDTNFGLGDGLGPRFNGDACRACHSEPVVGGAGPQGLNVVRHGTLTQDGRFLEPAQGTMAHRLLAASDGRAPHESSANVYEMRQAQPLFGLGLIERIPEAEIRARADPNDQDGDGLRGVASELPTGQLGRFGWKADIPSIREFVRDALTVELGLTLPEEVGFNFGQATDEDAHPDPEASTDDIDRLAFYMASLAPPLPRSVDAAAENRGRLIFEQVNCVGCHVAEWVLPDGTPVRAYSDFLLHEVLPEGSPGIPVHRAGPRAFRTAPLWGADLTAPYLHDGRAATLEEAISAHAGEAESSALGVSALSAADRADLLAFLRSI